RGESRDVLAVPVKSVCVLRYPLHTVLRAQSAPGFPCALCSEEGQRIARLRRIRVVGTETCVSSRQCEQSEAIQLLARGGKLDCFVASLLAMTAFPLPTFAAN